MPGSRNVIIHDRFGRSLRGRLLAGGHIVLSEHAHRYTYARINAAGEVELYDDAGNFSHAGLFAEEDDDVDPDEPGLAMGAVNPGRRLVHSRDASA